MLPNKEKIQQDIQICEKKIHNSLMELKQERRKKLKSERALKRGKKQVQCSIEIKGKRCEVVNFKYNMDPIIYKCRRKDGAPYFQIKWKCKSHNIEKRNLYVKRDNI